MRKLCWLVVVFLLAGTLAGCAQVNNIDIQSHKSLDTQSANAYASVSDGRQYLRMKDGKDFKIITVTDSHLDGENGTNMLIKYLGYMIDSHQPDIIVFNGDNIDYGVENGSTAENVIYRHLHYLERVFKFLEERRQHWTLTLGNHDRDPNIGGWPAGLKAENDLAVAYSNGEKGVYGMYRQAEAGYEEVLDWHNYADPTLNEWQNARYGDHAISIQDGDKTVYALMMLDSGQHERPGSEINGYLNDWQVKWYEDYMRTISEAQYGTFDLLSGKYIQSLIFMHQPLPEFVFAAQQAVGGNGIGTVPTRYGFGCNDEANVTLIQREGINNGMFATAKRMGAMGIYVGHNHGNNATIRYDGIVLCHLNRFGRRDGETGSWPENRVNFSTMITIKAKTYDVKHCFALYDGTTTTDSEFARNYAIPAA